MMHLLYVLPKHALSRVVGRIAHLKVPFFSKLLIRLFVRQFKVDIRELASPLESFDSLGDFFVRDLAPGARSIGEGVVSPVDGTLTEFGTICGGKLVQVKGIDYRIADLLGDAALAERFDSGFFFTLYLAPHNYHQIHMPVAGAIRESIYIPGELWPVNSWSVSRIKGLFARNERVISFVECAGALLAVVKVGATNVGSISLAYDSLRTNVSAAQRQSSLPLLRKTYSGLQLAKGAKLGAFHLGSTVVLLIEQGRFTPQRELRSGELKMGQSLGVLTST